jgi:hypothetical protein
MVTNWNALLAGFLTPVPEREPTKHLLAINDAERRYAAIRAVQLQCRSYFKNLTGRPMKKFKPLNQIQIATLTTMDLKTLEGMVRLNLTQDLL